MEIAKRDYGAFFKKYPTLRNPTDLNRCEKFHYATHIGWYRYTLMQRARKQHTEANEWPNAWTQPEYWLIAEGKA